MTMGLSQSAKRPVMGHTIPTVVRVKHEEKISRMFNSVTAEPRAGVDGFSPEDSQFCVRCGRSRGLSPTCLSVHLVFLSIVPLFACVLFFFPPVRFS